MIYSKEIQDELYEALKGLEPMLISLANGKTIVHPTMLGIAINGLQALAKANKEDTEWINNIAQY